MKKDKYLTSLRSFSGVYCIKNIKNKKVYVGSSISIGKMLSIHRSRLRGGYHPNLHLQRSWNKYGENSFIFRMLEIVLCESEVRNREQFWINSWKVLNPEKGYNTCPDAKGSRRSEETKRKISKAKKGVPMKKETKIKLSIARKGKPSNLTSEGRQKIGDASRKRKGIWKHSEETKRKISETKKGKVVRKGFTLSERQKQFLREYQLKNPTKKDPITGRFISHPKKKIQPNN